MSGGRGLGPGPVYGAAGSALPLGSGGAFGGPPPGGMYGYGAPPQQPPPQHHMPGEPPLLGAGLYGDFGGQQGQMQGGFMPPPQQPAPPMVGGGGGGFFLPATLTDEGEDGELYNGLPHSNLYVKNIPEDVTEDQLTALFRVYGTVDSCRLVRNLKTGASRGYGFVRYNNVEQARVAISALNGHTTAAGTRLEVKFADSDAGPKGAKAVPGTTPSDNLYLRNLPTNWGETELINLFKPHGDVVECRVLNAGQSGDPAVRGMGALVRMASVDQATAAIDNLNQVVPPGGTLPVIVRYADTAEDKARRQQRQIRGAPPPAGRYSPYSPPHAGVAGMPAMRPGQMPGNMPAGFQGFNPNTGMADTMMGAGSGGFGGADMGTTYTSLYVKNLPPEADKLFLYEKFAIHGAIASVRVMADDVTGACKGVGFVNYVDHAAALEAIRDLHGLTVGDKQLHVSLQTHRSNVHRR